MTRTEARILVVDDSELMRDVLKAELHGLGFERVDEAQDGEVALGKLVASHYDVVISDWQMPHMDGLSLVRHIRSMRGLEWLPVLLVTGHVTRRRMLEASEAGVSGFVAKPLVHESLDRQLNLFVGAPEAPAQVRP